MLYDDKFKITMQEIKELYLLDFVLMDKSNWNVLDWKRYLRAVYLDLLKEFKYSRIKRGLTKISDIVSQRDLFIIKDILDIIKYNSTNYNINLIIRRILDRIIEQNGNFVLYDNDDFVYYDDNTTKLEYML